MFFVDFKIRTQNYDVCSVIPQKSYFCKGIFINLSYSF